MSTGLIPIAGVEIPWTSHSGPIVIGKDILELLSSSMYVDPMAIFREYIQNAVDSTDEAHNIGLLGPSQTGQVQIDLDISGRNIRIRDNGAGIESSRFLPRMCAFGASKKKGSQFRGFRGVGRLAGIGYCQEVIFRAKAYEDNVVNEIRWDCRQVKSVLRADDFSGDLNALVNQAVSTRVLDAKGWPDHFFEVELRKVIRHRNDALLNGRAVQEFLSQVAPVPFSPSFRYADQISALLSGKVEVGNIDIRISGASEPVYRPHRNDFAISSTLSDAFTELQPLNIPGSDSGLAAVGWVLHHGYRGAIPSRTGVKGLRLRTGNIQIGDETLLQELFPEARFNSWAVGEIHVVDPKIIPNGRRDHYEQNGNYVYLVSHLRPLAHEISSRCRASSLRRNWLRQFEQQHEKAKERIAALRQGALPLHDRNSFETEVEEALKIMEKIAGRSALELESRQKFRPIIARVSRALDSVRNSKIQAPALTHLTSSQRQVSEKIVGLIYQFSQNASSAKRLVDKILSQLTKKR